MAERLRLTRSDGKSENLAAHLDVGDDRHLQEPGVAAVPEELRGFRDAARRPSSASIPRPRAVALWGERESLSFRSGSLRHAS